MAVAAFNGITGANFAAVNGILKATITAINGEAFSSGPSYLIEENCEGTGTPAGWTDSGAVNWDYTTSPLQGTQSMQIAPVGATINTTCPTFAAQTTLEYYMMFRFNSSLPSAGSVFVRLRDSLNAVQLRLQMNTGNRLLLYDGGAIAASPVTTIAAGTDYHVWMRYVAGTGANGIGTLGFSTTGIRPLSGNNFASFSNSPKTASITNFIVGTENNNTWDGVFDRLIASQNVIGNNP